MRYATCLLPRWAGSRKRLCCEISGVYAGARKRTAFHDQPFAEDCQWVLRGFHRFFAGFLGFLCDFGHKMGDFTGDYWRFGVCGGSGLGKTNLAKTPYCGMFDAMETGI